MGSRKILLINSSDDELQNRDLIDAGFDVETVQSADEIAEKLASAHYAGIVLTSDTSTGKSDADEVGKNAHICGPSPPEAEWQFAIADIVADRTETNLAYLDKEFNFVWVNSAYAEKSGYTKEKLIGRNHFDLFPNEENQAIFERVRESGEPYIAKREIIRVSQSAGTRGNILELDLDACKAQP